MFTGEYVNMCGGCSSQRVWSRFLSTLLAARDGGAPRPYFVTSHALSVYYVHSGVALSFPLAQLKSVGVWPEGGQSGSLTFLFRCDSNSAQCIQVPEFVRVHLPCSHYLLLRTTAGLKGGVSQDEGPKCKKKKD